MSSWWKDAKANVKKATNKAKNATFRPTAFSGEGRSLNTTEAPPTTVESKAIISPREAQRRAAEAREKQWKAKVSEKRTIRIALEQDNECKPPPGPSAAFLAAAQAETPDLTTLSFNPYEASFSSSGQARHAVSVTNAPLESQDTTLDENYAASQEETQSPIELILSSLGGDLVTLTTLKKILVKIRDNPLEFQYRKLRESTSTFQNKIASVPGATELLSLVGFTTHVLEDNETYWVLLPHESEGDDIDDTQVKALGETIDQLEVAIVSLN